MTPSITSRLAPGAVVAEVGAYRGAFSAEILSTPVSHLYLIDPWKKQGKDVYLDTIDDEDLEECYEQTLRNTECLTTNKGRVTIFRETSSVAALRPEIPPLDAAYIDGNHRFIWAMEDLCIWSRKLKPGGRLMGHDYTHNGCAKQLDFGVVEAVDCFCKHARWEIEYLAEASHPEDFTSFCLKKIE